MDALRSSIVTSLFKLCCCLLLAVFLQIPVNAFSEDTEASQTLIIYFSRTGITKLISETLAKNINADLLEIKDPQDRSGDWGFIKSGLDAFRHVHTPIEPEQPDVSPYSVIIIDHPHLELECQYPHSHLV